MQDKRRNENTQECPILRALLDPGNPDGYTLPIMGSFTAHSPAPVTHVTQEELHSGYTAHFTGVSAPHLELRVEVVGTAGTAPCGVS